MITDGTSIVTGKRDICSAATRWKFLKAIQKCIMSANSCEKLALRIGVASWRCKLTSVTSPLRTRLSKVLLKCVIPFSTFFRWYAFPNFWTQNYLQLAYGVRISSKSSATPELCLSLPRVINFKFTLRPHQKYVLHHTVWRTWLFISYSDQKLLYYQFSLPHLYILSLKG